MVVVVVAVVVAVAVDVPLCCARSLARSLTGKVVEEVGLAGLVVRRHLGPRERAGEDGAHREGCESRELVRGERHEDAERDVEQPGRRRSRAGMRVCV